MRTTDLLIRKLSQMLASVVMVVFTMLCLNSCQKEDVARPVTNSNEDVHMQRDIALPAFPVSFRSIKIDHNAGKSLILPGYSVTVYSDGLVIYDGKRNVRLKGVITFKTTPEVLREINKMTSRLNFFNIPGLTGISQDLPTVTTTFIENEMEPRTAIIIDDMSGYPKQIVAFRTQLEQMLNLSSYLSGREAEVNSKDHL